MKIPNIFFILGGGSQDVLDKITTLREHEKRKIVLFGMLLLIPVIFALLSMYLTLSMHTNNNIIIIGGSIAWAFVILVIDSVLMDGLRKSRHNQAGFWYGVGIFLRLAMAFVIGYAVSHQMVYYIFKDSINEKIIQTDKQHKSKQHQIALDNLSKETEKFDKKIKELTDTRDCLSELITMEQSYKGEPKEIFHKGQSCGSVSGKGISCEEICKSHKAKISKIENEINNKIAEKNEKTSGLLTQLKEASYSLENHQFTNDLLQKERALTELRKENTNVNQMYWVLLLLFLIIDTLIVVSKLSFPMGMYEHMIDAMIEQNKATIKAEENANIYYAKTVAEEEAKIVAKHKGMAKSILAMLHIPTEISISAREIIDEFWDNFNKSKTGFKKEIDINTKVHINEKLEDTYVKMIDKAIDEVEKE